MLFYKLLIKVFILNIFVVSTLLCQNTLKADTSLNNKIESLLKKMTLKEKIGQMCQFTGAGEKVKSKNATDDENIDEIVEVKLDVEKKSQLVREGLIGSFLYTSGVKETNSLQKAALESRLGIPLIIGTDAVHGHGMNISGATIFPSQIGMASSWDLEIVEQVARATAKEMRATGCTWTFSPTVDVVRDSRWGRIGESFGEDPLLVSKMGEAMVKGYQNAKNIHERVAACAKAFTGGSVSISGLNGGPAEISEQSLWEVHIPPYRTLIKAGVMTIMASHNEVNGTPCHSNAYYFNELIKNKWKFNGFIISDWTDVSKLYTVHNVAKNNIEAAQLAVQAGIDMHMHGPDFLNYVESLVNDGLLSVDLIDNSVRRILRIKYELGLFEKPLVDKEEELRQEDKIKHNQLALNMARKSIVLLKNNNNMLPLNKNVKSIFVTGSNANDQSILGDWSKIQKDNDVITVLEGIQNSVSKNTKVDFFNVGQIYDLTPEKIDSAALLAKNYDVAIVVVGENSIRDNPKRTSGENLDRPTLELCGLQLDLVKKVYASCKSTILVFVNGGPIASEWCAENIDGIIEAWEPGVQGGQAVADVIFGNYNPSGKLPLTIPRTVGHNQSYYNYKPSTYHRGKFRFFKKEPLYEFGYGLSYSNFEYSNLQYNKNVKKSDTLKISFDISNTSAIAGEEVAMLFIRDKYCTVTRPIKELKDFKKVMIDGGKKVRVEFLLTADQLSFYKDGNFIVENGDFDVIIGLNKLSGTFNLSD